MEISFFQNLHSKTIVIGGDHHAQPVVDVIEVYLVEKNILHERVHFDEDSKDYITQSHEVAKRVSEDPAAYCGIIGCKNGFGVTTVCNKYKNVFATRCDTPEQALDARKVNYCNVLTFGEMFVDDEEIKVIIDNWLNTEFELNEKNTDRLNRLFKIQSEC